MIEDLRRVKRIGSGGSGGGGGTLLVDDSFAVVRSFSGLGLTANTWNVVNLSTWNVPADSLIQIRTINTNTSTTAEVTFIVKEADTPDPSILANYSATCRNRNGHTWLVRTNSNQEIKIYVGGSFTNTFQTLYYFLKKLSIG